MNSGTKDSSVVRPFCVVARTAAEAGWPTAQEIACVMRADRPSERVRYVARFGAAELVWALTATGTPVGMRTQARAVELSTEVA